MNDAQRPFGKDRYAGRRGHAVSRCAALAFAALMTASLCACSHVDGTGAPAFQPNEEMPQLRYYGGPKEPRWPVPPPT